MEKVVKLGLTESLTAWSVGMPVFLQLGDGCLVGAKRNKAYPLLVCTEYQKVCTFYFICMLCLDRT